jgi:hypothetical protein
MKVFLRILVAIILLGLVLGVVIYTLSQPGSQSASSMKPGASVVASAAPVNSGLVISEVMAANKSVYPDEKGQYDDWVEIYNSTDGDIDLKGYTLTDDEKDIGKWGFPDITLKAKAYFAVFLSGDSQNDLDHGAVHSIVKLSAKGDKIILGNVAGQIVDSYSFKSMDENISHARMGSEWKATDKPTPGFENSDAGYEAFKKSMVVSDPPVLISEVMTSNAITLTDNTGAYSDWVEVVNVSAADVNLNGFGLSDRPDVPLKWRFPDVTLKPLEHLVVFCSGNPDASDKDPKKGLHAAFRLASYKETITLSNARGLLMDSVSVENLPTDNSYARVYEGDKPTGKWNQTGKPTPGYPNTDAAFEEFNKNHQLALGDVVISEVLSSNANIDLEKDGHTYDYIELANRGSAAVDLKGYGLTTNAKNPAKFRFPDMTLEPGKEVVVLASGLTSAQAQKKKYLHAPFNLSIEGETLALFNPEDKLIDKCNIGTMQRAVSIGREDGKDAFSYFTDPTPGEPNGKGADGMAPDVQFDKASGTYDGTIQLTLSASDGCDIYYTTDGGTPAKSSNKYSGPVSVDKTTVIRARAFKDGFLDGQIKTNTYFINPKHTLPLISIVTDHDNLFDTETGIYEKGPNAVPYENSAHYKVANYLKKGQESERPASFEVFDADGKRAFEQNIAIRIQGGFSRDNAQKSFSIIARSQYGSGSMKYRFFDDLPYTEYKSVILRDGGQDATLAKIKEAVELNLVKGNINCLIQAVKPYVVYLNGEYWGVYFMEEKRNKYFVAQHEKVENPDSINLLLGSGLNYIKNGTNKEYKSLMSYVGSHDMSQKENFDYVAERLDTDSFMDLMINQVYIGNSDYANLEFYQVPGGKWKQIFYDFCWTFQVDHPTLEKRLAETTTGSTMFKGLLAYKPWREKFLERFAWALETIYPTDRVLKAIDDMADAVASEIPAEHEKFNIANSWEKNVEKMRTFAKDRPAKIRAQIKSYFKLSDSEMEKIFG